VKRPIGAQRALAVAAGLVIIVLTGAAFWLSYAHLAEIAAAHGLEDSQARTWAWPATLDLFIIAGELMMLRAALAQQVDLWAIGLTVVGSGGSIALNVVGVGATADPLDHVVAGVPPTAALLAFGALMRQVHQALSVPAGTKPEPQPEPAELPELEAELHRVPGAPPATVQTPPTPVLGAFQPLPQLPTGWLGTTSGTNVDQVEQPHRAQDEDAPEPGAGDRGTAPEPPAVPPVPPAGSDRTEKRRADPPDTSFARHVQIALGWLKATPELTGTAIGKQLGASDSYGRRVRRAALEATE
jgi:hypothetical protein